MKKTKSPFKGDDSSFINKIKEKYFFIIGIIAFCVAIIPNIYFLIKNLTPQKKISRETKKNPESKPKSLPEDVSVFFKEDQTIKRYTLKKRKKASIDNSRQVIARENPILPAGKKIIARLITSLDSRLSSGIATARISFTVKWDGVDIIPRNSLLHGKISYPSGSERIFISFFKCVFPDGREFPLKGEALDIKDFHRGIDGNYHNKAGVRIAKNIALGMISPMANTLTEKEALGQGFAITAKPSMKNALLQGVSKSSEWEAKRQINDIKSDRDYLTVAAGKEIIVNLIDSFKGGQSP